MKIANLVAVSILTVAPLAACGSSDRNKQVQEATINEAEAATNARETQIDQQQKQQVEAIEANQPRTDNLPEATQQRAKAESAMIEDRQKFAAESQARLQKAQARLDEARTKVQVAGGKAPASINDELSSVSRMTAVTATDIGRLSTVSNDGWSAEKKRIESRLDDIDKAVDDVKSKADDLK